MSSLSETDLNSMVAEMMRLNRAPQQATYNPILPDMDKLDNLTVKACTKSPGPPPNNYAQADELIEGPVLQDILERLRRLERAVAELMVKSNMV